MAETSIALPFTIDPYGRVLSTQDQTKLWADRVRSVIGTALTERVMRRTFGTRIAATVFDSEESAEAEIKAEVETAFNVQLPLLSLKSVVTNFDSYTGNTNVAIVYDLPNNQTVTTSVAIAYIGSGGTTYEENL